MYCHRVLRTLQHAAETSTVFVSETWNCLLKFMLAVANALLSPPSSKSSLLGRYNDNDLEAFDC